MKNLSIHYHNDHTPPVPGWLELDKDKKLFNSFITQIHTEDYFNEVLKVVNEVLTGKLDQYIFEHNDVYLTLQKDITSTRVEYIQDQYPEGEAPKDEYYAEIETKEFLEVLNFWWENYSEYLKKVSKKV